MATYVIRHFDDALKNRVKAAGLREGLSLREAILTAMRVFAEHHETVEAFEREGGKP